MSAPAHSLGHRGTMEAYYGKAVEAGYQNLQNGECSLTLSAHNVQLVVPTADEDVCWARLTTTGIGVGDFEREELIIFLSDEYLEAQEVPFQPYLGKKYPGEDRSPHRPVQTLEGVIGQERGRYRRMAEGLREVLAAAPGSGLARAFEALVARRSTVGAELLAEWLAGMDTEAERAFASRFASRTPMPRAGDAEPNEWQATLERKGAPTRLLPPSAWGEHSPEALARWRGAVFEHLFAFASAMAYVVRWAPGADTEASPELRATLEDFAPIFAAR